MSRSDLSKLSNLSPDALINFTNGLFIKLLSYQDHSDDKIGPLALPGIDDQINNELTAKLTYLIIDGAKMDLSPNDFRSSLEENGADSDCAIAIGRLYEDRRVDLQKLLQRTRFSLPQLVGVTWRLDHVIRSKHVDRLHRPLFFVRLQILSGSEAAGGGGGWQGGDSRDVTMTCTVEQLQDLHVQLKDAAAAARRCAAA